MNRVRRSSGQSALENMLVVSVLTVAVVGASFVFVPSFRTGTGELSEDVRGILDGGTIGTIGQQRGGGDGVDAGGGAGMAESTGDSGRGTNGAGSGHGPDAGQGRFGEIIAEANSEMASGRRESGDSGGNSPRTHHGESYPRGASGLGDVTGGVSSGDGP